MEFIGLAGKVTTVTGGGHGIAREVSLLLAASGVAVGVVDVDPDAAARTVADIEAAGGTALAVTGDLRYPGAADACVGRIADKLGGVDVMINACGGTAGVRRRILEMTAADWQAPFDLNLVPTVHFTRAAAQRMVAAGRGGAVVNFASTAGLHAAPNLAAYGAAKAAICQFTKTAAVELAPHSIRVNAIALGNHWGARSRALADDPLSPQSVRDYYTGMETTIPLGRIGAADDSAGAVLFLASDLSRYMTGHTLVSDGGVSSLAAGPRFGGG